MQLAESKVKRKTEGESGIGMLMNLRKIANHPLLVRNHYDDRKVSSLAKILKKDASHKDATEKFIVEDLSVMSDFDIHKTCLAYRVRRQIGLYSLWVRVRRHVIICADILVCSV